LAPTVVPKLLATSFAPTENDKKNAITKARTRIQSADSGTHAETVVPVPMQSKKIVKELAATTLERNST